MDQNKICLCSLLHGECAKCVCLFNFPPMVILFIFKAVPKQQVGKDLENITIKELLVVSGLKSALIYFL